MLPSAVTSELKKHYDNNKDDQYWIENQNKLSLNIKQQLHDVAVNYKMLPTRYLTITVQFKLQTLC